ncbi:MAG: heme biosynthesis protein HemY [Rhodopseudomonas sp.]|nr:heme biosynthesis protein HemY [Rhodopseudomonas sp.]
MIRVVLFLVALALIATGFVWFADRPGDVAVTWMGYRVETSLMVAALAVAALVVVVMIVWSILRGIWRSPEQVSLFFRHRRAMRGYLAITRGLVAIGAGDTRLAVKSADEAARLSPGDPLMLLLSAQSAQLSGDRIGAERAFHEMLRHENTKLLGLRGLYIEAQRRNDSIAVRRFAEEAAKVAPALTWAGQAVLDDRCAQADWTGALVALDHMKSALEKSEYRRKRAVLLTANALALADGDRDASRAAVLEAVKLAPGLVPAAALAGRRLSEAGDQRRAGKVLIGAWRLNPHPDLADAYADLRPGDSARARLTRMQSLADKTPGDVEGALAVARAALDAREFATARSALSRYLTAPTRRVATLMAEIEETEHGDEGKVREWMGRAMRAGGDPVWTADGVVSDRWLPVSPSGKLDGYQWRVPLSEIGMTHPVIDAAPPPLPEPRVVVDAGKPGGAGQPAADTGAVKKPEIVVDVVPPSKAAAATAPTAVNSVETVQPAAESTATPVVSPEAVRPPDVPKPAVKPKPVDAVIPLVHAPDDPGLDPGIDAGHVSDRDSGLGAGLDTDPVPETVTPPAQAAWQRIKQIFR